MALSLKGVIPDQSIARGTVKFSLQKLCAKGVVRRHERLGNLTYFVSANYTESPIEHEPIRKLLEDALRGADRPLRLIEFAVRVKDASKFAKVSKKNIISTVFQALSRSKDLFVRDADKRWSRV